MTELITQLYGASHEGFTPLHGVLLANDPKHGYGDWKGEKVIDGLSIFTSPTGVQIAGLLARYTLCTTAAAIAQSEEQLSW